MRFLCFILSVVLGLNVSAFTLSGSITDEKGAKLTYVNIYIKGTSNGTSANAEGLYSIELKSGDYEVVFQHIGFAQRIERVSLAKNTILNVALKEMPLSIGDVVINASDDPANAVIRNAIARRKYFLNAVETYSCDAYVKGMQRLTDAPSWAASRIRKRGIVINKDKPTILYLSESVSKLYYKKPNKFHEVVYSSKVSGNSDGFTFNSAQDFFFNFYEKNITIEGIASRPLISPLSDNAFFFYKFKMLGAYNEDGRLINKIQVTPKRKSDPCFSGVLSIVENNWNIHSLQLVLTKDNGIQFVDSLKVTQYFIPIKDDLWLPSQQRYDAKASFLGVKGDGYYLGVFKNYQLNNSFGKVVVKDTVKLAPKLQKKKAVAQRKAENKIFTPEIIKIESIANLRDTVYWDSIRPIPLTEIEVEDYSIKDSIEAFKETTYFKDSTDKFINTPKFMNIVLGYNLVKQSKQITFRFPSLLGIVNYNTVEGVNFQFKFSLTKRFEKDGRRLNFEPTLRYGLSNRSFNAMASLSFRNSQRHEEYFNLSGGKFISQFNELQPQPFLGNTMLTLIMRNNYMKLYEQYFVKLGYSREVYNGITGGISFLYAQRTPLENTSLFSFFPKLGTFTPNGVDLPGVSNATSNISSHTSFRMDMKWRFRFGQKRINRPDFVMRITSNFPELTLIYKKAFGIKNFSDINFDFLEAQVEGLWPMKLFGTMHYRFGGGGFASAQQVDYNDFKHFFGNFLTQGETDLLGFFTIRYYTHSTNRYFAEAHIEHHFDGFFFNKIPGFRKLKLEEVIGFHFLYTPTRKQYFQLDVGIENILKIFRVDFVTGFGSTKGEYYFGGRVGMALDLRR